MALSGDFVRDVAHGLVTFEPGSEKGASKSTEAAGRKRGDARLRARLCGNYRTFG